MSTTPLRLLKFSTLLLTLAACGSSGGGSATGGGNSTTGSGGSATTGGGATQPYTGFVIFGQIASVADDTGQAGFYTTISNASCPGGTAQGSCCYQSNAAQVAYGKTVPRADVNAGSISLQDGTRSLASLPFTADAGYAAVNSISTASVTWVAGDTLGVSATGDASGVASFAGTVIAPAPLTGVTPALSTLGMISLSRTSDFTLTWAASSAETVLLSISAVSGETGDGTIRCTASGSAASLTVPAALLGNFQSGDTADLGLTASNNTALSAANASVELTAEIISSGSGTVE